MIRFISTLPLFNPSKRFENKNIIPRGIKGLVPNISLYVRRK